MAVLALDSSSGYSNILIMDEGFNVISESISDFHENHSVVIFKQFNEIFDSEKLRLKDIKGISVLLGPGSYTGVRVALVIAKTLSYIFNLNIIGLGSLFACAYSSMEKCSGSKFIIAVKHAGRGDYYIAVYEIKGGKIGEYLRAGRLSTAEIISLRNRLGNDTAMVFGYAARHEYEKAEEDFKGTASGKLFFDLRKLPFAAAKYFLESGINNDLKYNFELSPVYIYSEGPF